MLVKENSSTKIIEDKMEFTFKDLEIIGKYKIGKIDVVFYRNSKKIFVFQIYDSSQITIIIRIPKLTSDNVKLQYRFEINGKVYNYDADLMLFIKFCGETIFYTFYKILLYKYKDKFLIFKIYNENNIHSIAVVTNIQKSNWHSFSSFKINNNVYDYEEEREIFASKYNDRVEYDFFDKNYEQCYDWKIVRKDYLKISDEEMVMLKLTGEFLDEKKLR